MLTILLSNFIFDISLKLLSRANNLSLFENNISSLILSYAINEFESNDDKLMLFEEPSILHINNLFSFVTVKRFPLLSKAILLRLFILL